MSSNQEAKAKFLKELRDRKEQVQGMGGEKALERQRKLGKLNARQRIHHLLDKGSFTELGALVKHRGTELGIEKKDIPADAVITGFGKINSRKVYVFSQDFTTIGGTLGAIHGRKICEIMDRAAREGCPLIGINDSGGARIQEGVDSLSAYGQIFYRNTIYSGVVPQICAIIGPCAGGAVYSPALMDFVFMVEGISYAFITGPRVIKEVTGEEIGEMELGGAMVHQQKSAFVHRIEKSEEECMGSIKRLLSYLPQNNLEDPPRVDTGDDPNRVDETLFDVLPPDPAKPYNMYDVIDRVFDLPLQGEETNHFNILPLFAPNIITTFARLNGYSVGIVANQPKVKAGTLDIDSSDKASRFIMFCDAFNIPLVNLVDVPGYLPGKDQEWGGIIRHGAKMLYAYAEATVPKITLIFRKAYGGSYLAMCSKDMGADFVLAWPTTEMAVMGPDGAAPILFKEEIEKAPDPKRALQEKVKLYRETFANPYKAAANLHIDDVIDPSETRPLLIKTLEASLTKREDRPRRKHGVPPT